MLSANWENPSLTRQHSHISTQHKIIHNPYIVLHTVLNSKYINFTSLPEKKIFKFYEHVRLNIY